MSSKKALVVRRFNFAALQGQIPMVLNPDNATFKVSGSMIPELLSIETVLADRPACETNPELLQLIPYIVLIDCDTDRLFVYTREQDGDEERLHGKCSIGVGGHIEIEPQPGQSLAEVIVSEMARKLDEEVGLTMDEDDQYAMAQLLPTTSYYLFTEEDAVSQVHLGILVFQTIAADELGECQEGHIGTSEWLTVSELEERIDYDEIELESWSEMALDILKQRYT